MGLIKRGQKWYIQLRHNSRLVRIATGTNNKKLAQEIEAKTRIELVEGKYFDKGQGDKKTFKDMTDKYMEQYANQKADSSKRIDDVSLKHLLPEFGDKYLSKITPDQIVRYKAQRRNEGASASSINKELAFSKHAYNLGIREWGWLQFNPFARVGLEKLPEPRDRHLTPREYESLYEVCNDRLKPIVQIAVYSGMRQDEILSLEWKQIDFKNEIITIEHTKSGHRRSIPMIAPIKNLMLQLGKIRRIDSQYVLPSAEGTKIDASKVRSWFRQACRKAGIENFRFHDLRHTSASWLVQHGVDLYVVQRILGHASSAMTQRYSHLVSENLRRGLDTLITAGDHKNDHSEQIV